MNTSKTSIIWFRNDLRLQNNLALVEACKHNSMIPLFIWDPETEEPWSPGAASRWYLHHSLNALNAELEKQGSKLILLKGNRFKIFETLVLNHSIDAVHWMRSYEPEIWKTDAQLEDFFHSKNVHVQTHAGKLIFEPGQIVKSDGSSYRVYTAFWKAFLNQKRRVLKKEKISIPPLPEKIRDISVSLETLKLLPKITWDREFYTAWKPGEQHAHESLETFLKSHLIHYEKQRDIPSVPGTSRLSPHLHFGEIDPSYIFERIESMFGEIPNLENPNIVQFCKELVWREFSYHLMYEFPTLPEQSMVKSFERFPWTSNSPLFKAWKRGKTGYPIIDAGMRQLWRTGWMHNRVRMLVASFLTKDLHISWQEGARWFWDTLVDADLANNTQGWQWTAGCGFDAAPFFRIFNPTTQSEKFDPEGIYIKTWCPELKNLSKDWIHAPWLAPNSVLTNAKIRLGVDYPLPIVDHKMAREKSLQAYKNLRR